MWVYVDESGHPHPNDTCEKSVLVAVCLDESYNRQITLDLHNLKRDLLGKEDYEVKAKNLLRPSTFLRVPAKRELVEAIFDLCGNLPLQVFAVIMPRPRQLPMYDLGYLPVQYVHLLQRVQILMEARPDKAIMVFDDGGPTGIWKARLPQDQQLLHRASALLLSRAFTNFLFRHPKGRQFDRINEVPFFVSSEIVPGLQIADLIAGCIRLCHQTGLHEARHVLRPFDSALKRFYSLLETKKQDLVDRDGSTIWAFYSMSERALMSESAEGQPIDESAAPK